jgi:predicted negative regulator of RcsB-dependent stress response
MAAQSAFDTQQIQEINPHGSTGLLEHLNLPPVAIRFIRKNKKTLQAVAAGAGVVIIAATIYSSYRVNRMEKASAALATAMQSLEAEKYKALTAVAADFSGTPAAQWAIVEVAHGLMKTGNYKEAVVQYESVRKGTARTNPLFALLSFGLAQAHEGAGDLDAALAEYTTLQKSEGFQGEGYNGMARIYEVQGKHKEALAVYEEYLATFTGQNQNDPEKIAVDEKIARLKSL